MPSGPLANHPHTVGLPEAVIECLWYGGAAVVSLDYKAPVTLTNLYRPSFVLVQEADGLTLALGCHEDGERVVFAQTADPKCSLQQTL